MRETERERADERNQMTRRGTRRPDATTRDKNKTETSAPSLLSVPPAFVNATYSAESMHLLSLSIY